MAEADRIAVSAPAKINLLLHVGPPRPDGYHDLESLVAFANVGDTLVIERANDLTLAIEGRFAHQLANEADNLVLRAARALAARAGREAGAHIVLTKNLPVASGIGGGSADAAAALRGLSDLWGIRLPASELRAIAAELGSDVPACVSSSPAWIEGRGERVTQLKSLPVLDAVLVNPGVALSTAQVFAAMKDSRGVGMAKPDGFSDAGELLEFLNATANDLEAPAVALAPAVSNTLIALAAAGASLARMSGSGATCFGIFPTTNAADTAARAVANTHPDWWVRAARLTPLRE